MEIPKGQEQDNTRRLMISIENRTLGDESFRPYVKNALEGYLRLLTEKDPTSPMPCNKAGNLPVEVLSFTDGTVMVVTHVSSLAHYIIVQDPNTLLAEVEVSRPPA